MAIPEETMSMHEKSRTSEAKNKVTDDKVVMRIMDLIAKRNLTEKEIIGSRQAWDYH